MNCIIIEDEIPAQKVLQNFIGKIPYLTLQNTFKAAIEANGYLNSRIHKKKSFIMLELIPLASLAIVIATNH